MSATYNAYSLNNLHLNKNAQAANSGVITSTGDGTNILGDVVGDTFVMNGTTYTYEGVTQYYNAEVDGRYVYAPGFVASANGTSYLFAPSSQATSDKLQVLTLTPDSPGNSATEWSLTTNAPGCFVAGTLIATPAGEVAVEALVPGDLVLTADGRQMAVRWLGRSVVSRVFADPVRILPVRIKAGALGDNLPVRDLVVSPGHAVRVGDVLAHAGALINGTSIVRDDDAPMVFTYYHLELDTHALVIAEGAPAESFLEGVEDMGFANWDERTAAPMVEEMAYPRAKSVRQLPQAVREHLAARAVALSGAVAKAA